MDALLIVLAFLILATLFLRGQLARMLHVSTRTVALGGLACLGVYLGLSYLGGFGLAGISMAALYTIEELPTTSQAAIREFQERYIMGTALAPPPTWANQYGDVINVTSPFITFPTSLLSMKFRETKQFDGIFKSMQEQSFDVKVVEFDEGVEAPVIDLRTNVFAYRKWLTASERFRVAEQQHIANNIASILEANGACGWDKVAMFSALHLINPADPSMGTFSNLQTVATSVLQVSNLEAEVTNMCAQVKDENGQKIEVVPDMVLVPTEKWQPLVNYLKQDIIAKTIQNVAGAENVAAATIRNPYTGGLLTAVHVRQLTNTVNWYLLDSKLVAAAMPPWIAAKYDPGSDLSLRIFDESSDYFKKSGKIAISNHIWFGFATVFPHAIRKVTGA